MGSFTEILKETMRFLFKNKNLLISINIITLLYSLYFMFMFHSTSSLIDDLFYNLNSLFVKFSGGFIFSNLPVWIEGKLRSLVNIVWISSFAYLNIMLFSVPATIIASFIIYSFDNLSFKDFVSKLIHQWRRPFLTYLYTTVFDICYTVLALAILAFIIANTNHSRTSKLVYIVHFFLLVIFYLYLDVVWSLGTVVSTMEERLHGKEAILKASKLVEGRKIVGFALNAFFMQMYIVLYQCFKISALQLKSQRVIWLLDFLLFNSLCLVKILKMVAYTAFYYQLKKSNCEEIEL